MREGGEGISLRRKAILRDKMKPILLGLFLGLLLFGCTAPEAQAPAEEPQAPAPEPQAPVEESGEHTPEAVPDETEETEEVGDNEPTPVSGEGTVIEVGESIPIIGDDESAVSESELSAHITPASCWVLYEGKVYDVTGYLMRHPGGSGSIEPYCGMTDGSFADAFGERHGSGEVEVLKIESILVGNYKG